VPPTTRAPRWALPLIVGGVVLIAVQHRWPTPAGTVAHNAIQLCVPFVLVWGASIGLRGQRRPERILIMTFAVINAVVQVYWTFSGAISGPSSQGTWADDVSLFALALGVIGLLILSTRGLSRWTWGRVASDSALVAASMMAVVWINVFQPMQAKGLVPGGVPTFFVLPAVDLVGLAVILIATLHQPERSYLRWLSAGVAAAALSDIVNAYHHGHGHSTDHLVVICGWFAAPAFLALGARLVTPTPPSFGISSTRRLWVYVPVVAAIASAVFLAERGPLDRTGIAMCALLGLCLVINQGAVSTELRGLLDAKADALALLGLSQERFRVAFEGSPIGIAVIEDGVITDANPLMCQLFGRTHDELLGLVPERFVPHDVRDVVRLQDWRVLTGSTVGRSFEFDTTRPDGTVVTLALTVAKSDDFSSDRRIAIAQDVTQLRADTERLANLARRDELTGLTNRATFVTIADQHLTNPGPQGTAIAFLDIDRFKVINDSLGHVSGDRVLQSAAHRIAEATGDDGIVSRFAGDEFTILFPDTSPQGASEVLERVRVRLRERVELGNGASLYPTASVGVTWLAPGTGDSRTSLAQADAAMYRAKALGRNRVEFFDRLTTDLGENELRIVADLHKAIANHELRAFYQPIIDVATGHTSGFEALLRWQHPTRGLLPPSEFIDAAESSGLIVEIGEWILREALAQLATWTKLRPARPITMSVNMASRQITDDYADLVAEVLGITGVDPDSVWLEITETALMADVHAAEKILSRLTALGVHLTVDDFGTGYSSLTYLRRFPVDGIKVDKSFTEGLGQDHQADAICEGVISLGNALGLKTVAEGVEQPVQMERLRQLGCLFAQGYLFSRPVPPEQITIDADLPEQAAIPERAR